jgi:hypothetical protein
MVTPMWRYKEHAAVKFGAFLLSTPPTHGPTKLAAASAALAIGLSCNAAAVRSPAATPPPAAPVATATAAPRIEPVPLLPAHVIGETDDENSACFFARRADGGLVLLSTGKHLYTRSVDASGTPRSAAPLEVSAIGADVSLGAMKAVGDGYLAAWVEPATGTHAVKMLVLDADGRAMGPTTLVAQVADEISSVDVLPNATGALVLWELPHKDATRADRSDLVAVAVTGGKLDGTPLTVASNVIGWEAEASARGAALAFVVPGNSPESSKGRNRSKKGSRVADPPADGRETRTGKVYFAEVDPKAKVGVPVVVSAEPTAQIDVMLADLNGVYLVAWTDERNLDSAVFVASIEPGGKLTHGPQPATPPFGEEALVALVSEPYVPGVPRSQRALLAWEHQLNAPTEGRTIQLATLGADGAMGSERATLTFAASGPPDIVADGAGYAALTLAPVRHFPDGVTLQDPKGDAPIWPAYVRFGADLTVLASEPVRATPFAVTDGVPYLTRSLSCLGGICTAVGTAATTRDTAPKIPNAPDASNTPNAADAGVVGAPIAIVELPRRTSPWTAPAARATDAVPPRAVTVRALHDGDHLSKVAAADLAAGGTVAAWVTYVLEPAGATARKRPSRGGAARGATVNVRVIAPDGTLGSTVALTDKAVSVGGVAVAAATADTGKPQNSAVAYVARDGSEPQVVVAKVGPTGEKLAQKVVTTVSRRPKKKGDGPSEASDVAIAHVGGDADSWITAWVDTRDGDAEIYVAKLDRHLAKVVPDQRITEAIGNAAEVQLAVRENDVVLAWADARNDPTEGNCDIYVAHLDAATLRKTGPEVRLFASVPHSRTPQVVKTAKGFVVAWIEEPAEGRSGLDPDAGLRIAELDAHGTPIGPPRLVRGVEEHSTVTAAALSCSGESCRGVLSSEVSGTLLLSAFVLGADLSSGPVKAIAAMTGPGSEDTSPALAGEGGTSLFFADDSVGGSGRVRWMQLQWK